MLLSLLLGSTLAIKEELIHELKPGKEICYTEDLPEMTSYIFESLYGSDDLAINIMDPDQKTVFTQEDNLILFKDQEGFHAKYPSTTYKEGEHRFCFLNQGKQPQRYSLLLRTGVDANDYSTIAKQKDLEGPALEAYKIEDQTQNLFKGMRMLVRGEERIKRNTNKVRENTFFFFAVTMGVMMVSSGIVYLVLRTYFRNKKAK